MATRRLSSRRRNNSKTGASSARRNSRAQSAQQRSVRKVTPADLLADLHAYRKRIAARFNYDVKKIGVYFDSVTIPPGLQVIEFPETKPRTSRKSA